MTEFFTSLTGSLIARSSNGTGLAVFTDMRFAASQESLPSECDVLVIGSGAAGLAAALVTSASGLSTIILEKSALFGGTTAMSGAAIWIPANHLAAAAGRRDTPQAALAYIEAAAPLQWKATERQLWHAFVQAAPVMLRFVEARTPLRFELLAQPDPLPRLPGAGTARMVSPLPLRRRAAPCSWRHLHPGGAWHLFTFAEMLRARPFQQPVRAIVRHLPILVRRLFASERAQGTALVAGLLAGCVGQGARVFRSARATGLVLEDGRVRGVTADRGGVGHEIRARRGVVLATGGFEWDPILRQRHFPGLEPLLASPSTNTGDGHRMAAAAGAAMAHMDQANLSSGVPLEREGLRALSVYLHRQAAAILVDGAGKRFVDESLFNLGEHLLARDPRGAVAHPIVWCVGDRRLLKAAPLVRWFSRRARRWIHKASDADALERRMKLPPGELLATLVDWNRGAAFGQDPAFGRTASPDMGMAPIQMADLVAIRFHPTLVSTKGGPRTDAQGHVLDADDRVISGLFCAGVAMANPIGTRAVSAGTTLGPNLTWGYICGRSLVDA